MQQLQQLTEYLDHERRIVRIEHRMESDLLPLVPRVRKLERYSEIAKPIAILCLLGFANLQPDMILKLAAKVLLAL